MMEFSIMISFLSICNFGILLYMMLFYFRKMEDRLKKEVSQGTKENLENLLNMLEQHKVSLDEEVMEVSKMYLEDITNLLEEYKEHLEVINEFETYSGDEVIANLIRHTKSIIKDVENFRISQSPQKDVEEKEENV